MRFMDLYDECKGNTDPYNEENLIQEIIEHKINSAKISELNDTKDEIEASISKPFFKKNKKIIHEIQDLTFNKYEESNLLNNCMTKY